MPRFLVEFDARLTPPEALSDVSVTDIIETVTDGLDGQEVEPSLGTTRVGDAVDFTVSLIVEVLNEIAAIRAAALLVDDAFARTGLGASEVLGGLSLRSSLFTPA